MAGSKLEACGVQEWAQESILFAGNDVPDEATVTAVAAAVTKIAGRQCPSY
jgi:hypothetical protein